MLTAYIDNAMRKAHYEILADGEKGTLVESKAFKGFGQMQIHLRHVKKN